MIYQWNHDLSSPMELNPKQPRIVTALPGPRAERLLRQDHELLAQGSIRVYPLVIDRAQGSWVYDVDGNLFLDFTSGIGVTATGHNHPRVIAAIQVQLGRFLHLSSAMSTYDLLVELAERLARTAPVVQPAKVFFGNSGTEAIEGALKVARWSTGRPYILAFLGGFHGRTLGAMSLSATTSDHRQRVGPLPAGVFHVPYPDLSQGLESKQVLMQIERLFATILPPSELAAVIVEPIQGGAGVVTLPGDLLSELRALADQHGFCLIVDEVYSGIGRTGKMWAVEHWDVQPDVICFAKGIASGMPLGGFIAREGLLTWPQGTHSSTFGGNPIACAAALTTLDLLNEGLIQNAAEVGAFLLSGLQELARHAESAIARTCGKGLMIGLELHTHEQAQALLWGAYRQGLLLLPAGQRGVRLAPPLTVTEDEAATALSILAAALDTLAVSQE